MSVPLGEAKQTTSVAERASIRWLLALGGLGALGYGAWLGTDKDASGVAVAAAFAVALLMLTVAIAGAVPANIKVGYVQLDMYAQGKADGVVQGAKLTAKAAAGMSPEDLTHAADTDLPPRAPRTAALQAVREAASVVQEAADTIPKDIPNKRADSLGRIARV